MLLALLALSLPVLSTAGTLGYTGTGDSSETFSNSIRGNVFNTATGFIADTVHVYFPSSPGSMMVVGVYDFNPGTGQPTTLLSSVTMVTPIAGWNAFPLSTLTPIYGGPGHLYFLALQFSSPATPVGILSTGGAMQLQFSPWGGPDWPDPFSDAGTAVAGANVMYCMYLSGINFTPTSTSTATRTATLTATRTPTYTRTPTATPTRTITLTSTITLTASITITSTGTPLPTATPTATITPTITQTVTITPSLTLTPFIIGADQVVTYPSPGRGNRIWFYYQTGGPTKVTIEIYNLVGERCTVLTDEITEAGFSRTPWQIHDVAPGVYLFRLRLESASETRTFRLQKIVIVK